MNGSPLLSHGAPRSNAMVGFDIIIPAEILPSLPARPIDRPCQGFWRCILRALPPWEVKPPGETVTQFCAVWLTAPHQLGVRVLGAFADDVGNGNSLMPSFTLTSSDIGHQADSPLTEVHSGILEQEQSGFQRLQRHLATASGRREDILGVDMFLTADDLESRRVLADSTKVENEPARRRGAPPADAPDGFIGLGPKLIRPVAYPMGRQNAARVPARDRVPWSCHTATLRDRQGRWVGAGGRIRRV